MPKRTKQPKTQRRSRRAAAPLAHVDPDALEAEQGIRPVMDPRELYANFWPENETADEFIEAVRQWRREGNGAPS